MTQKVEFAVPSTSRKSELHLMETRVTQAACCALQLAASPSRALSKLPEHSVLLDEGVAPPAQ